MVEANRDGSQPSEQEQLLMIGAKPVFFKQVAGEF